MFITSTVTTLAYDSVEKQWFWGPAAIVMIGLLSSISQKLANFFSQVTEAAASRDIEWPSLRLIP
jgi:hypothetical protein